MHLKNSQFCVVANDYLSCIKKFSSKIHTLWSWLLVIIKVPIGFLTSSLNWLTKAQNFGYWLVEQKIFHTRPVNSNRFKLVFNMIENTNQHFSNTLSSNSIYKNTQHKPQIFSTLLSKRELFIVQIRICKRSRVILP